MSRIFGVSVHDLRSEHALRELCEGFLDGDRTFRIFTPNPEILLRARHDPAYAGVLNSADLALPDGTGVAVVESLRSGRRVRRWPGIEIAGLLLRIAADRGAAVVLLGGAHNVAEEAAARWREAAPGLRIEVVGAGIPFTDDGVAGTVAREAEVGRAIASVRPAIVLVGLGAPKQEQWIARHVETLPSVRIMMGVGGTFDMWAGRLERAPKLLHRLGLEWAWRLALEPRRLRRILRATVVFPIRAFTERANGVRRGRATSER